MTSESFIVRCGCTCALLAQVHHGRTGVASGTYQSRRQCPRSGSHLAFPVTTEPARRPSQNQPEPARTSQNQPEPARRRAFSQHSCRQRDGDEQQTRRKRPPGPGLNPEQVPTRTRHGPAGFWTEVQSGAGESR